MNSILYFVAKVKEKTMASKNFRFGMLVMLLTFGITVIGCVSTLPISSSVNDFVLMGIKTNASENVDFTFQSEIQDGTFVTFGKDKAEPNSMTSSSYNISQNSTFSRMIKSYIGNKFQNISPDGTTKIAISLEDFWLEESSSMSANAIILGGAPMYNTAVRLKVLVKIVKDSKEDVKVITSSSEDSHMRGGRPNWREETNIFVSRIVNDANNRALMLINSLFNEMGL
jgi:hypothetical protein